MKRQVPSPAELRDYALGRGSDDSADRVRRYLLTSGDEAALRMVEAISAAQRRVEALRARSSGRWLTRIGALMRELGQSFVELPAGTLWVTSEAAVTLGSPRAHRSTELRTPVPRFLYVAAADALGRYTLLAPADAIEDVARVHVRAVVPEAAVAVIGIAADVSLMADGAVSRAGPTLSMLFPRLGAGAMVELVVCEIEEGAGD